MSGFSPAEAASCAHLIELALAEDLGPGASVSADVTSSWLLGATARGRAVFVARQAGVLAGLPAAALVCAALDATLDFTPLRRDGESVRPGDRLAVVTGPMRSLLASERTALNFVQHLGGIATLTRRYVDAIAGLPCVILDTRKTIPGWRLLAKYAVRQGGGHNHRMGLHDMALIKDNHWAALPTPRDLARSFAAFRAAHPEIPIEIEIDALEQLDEVLAAGPDIVLLDNMTPEQMGQAVRRRDAQAPRVRLEASGGVNLQSVRAIAASGVDRISVGALTHSAPALDVALDYEEAAVP